MPRAICSRDVRVVSVCDDGGQSCPKTASFVALANHSAPSHVPLQALVPGVLATPEQRGLSSRSMVDMRWLRTRSNSFVFLVRQRKDSHCGTKGQTSSGRARRSNYLNGSNARKIAPVCVVGKLFRVGGPCPNSLVCSFLRHCEVAEVARSATWEFAALQLISNCQRAAISTRGKKPVCRIVTCTGCWIIGGEGIRAVRFCIGLVENSTLPIPRRFLHRIFSLCEANPGAWMLVLVSRNIAL
jgi:hypothetical protein